MQTPHSKRLVIWADLEAIEIIGKSGRRRRRRRR